MSSSEDKYSPVKELLAGDDDENEEQNAVKGKETRNTVVLGLAFYAAFTAFHALQNLQSSLNDAHNLGVISLSVVYGAFVLSGILAPTVIKYLGIKKTILLSFVCHLIYTCSNFYPSFYTLIPSSAVLGGISGPLWTSQSTYVTICAQSKAKCSGDDMYKVMSRLTGLFYSIFQTTQLPGNLISSLVLDFGTSDQNNNETSDKICGRMACPSSANNTLVKEPDEKFVYILLGVFIAFNIAAILITVIFLTPVQKSSWMKTSSIGESLSSIFVTLVTTKLVFLAPFILYLAFASSFLAGEYNRSYISCTLGIHYVGFASAIYGGLNAASAISFGHIAKYTGRYVLFTLAACLHAGIFTVMYLWTPGPTDMKYILAIPAVWGLADGILNTQFIALIALLFSERKEPAFANFHTCSAVGATLTFALASLICVETKLYVIYALLAVSFILYTGVEIHHKVYDKNKEEYKIVN